MVHRLLVCVLLTGMVACGQVQAEPVEFSRDVAPILIKRCLECHNERDASGGLVLTDAKSLAAGGESGLAIDRTRPEEGTLLARVSAGEMPPPKRGQSQELPERELEILRAWVAGGAPWPAGRTLDLYEITTEVRAGRDWWSLQPLRRVAVPVTQRRPDWAHTPVDRFIQHGLEARGWDPAPEADRRTLMIRVSIDLVGLPPTYAEIQEFMADPAPDAYERLVDRLLASPHFGERRGRAWLDLVRYADTCGYERDQELPFAWKYRDWVIRALNEDRPYDRFLIDQIAGDEVAEPSEDSVTATGFLRLGTWNDEPNDPNEYKYDRLEDLVHATSTAFLGLTVKCARCHDHKFDPITQVDYYRMAAAFWPGPIEPRQRELLGGPSREELGYDVLGWTDIRVPPPLHLLRKGEPRQPLGVVEPAPLSLMPALQRAFEPAPLGARTTHRRRQLAHWMTNRDNPLTPRVQVNRLWGQHFGAALVRSPDNFGFTGDRPTHPELLDWLAREALPSGRTSSTGGHPGSQKRLHRLLVSSAVYRQHSLHPRQQDYSQFDAANTLWWRAERRPFESETLRDRLLFVGGDLDTRMAGPGFRPTVQPEALEGLSRKEGAWKPSPEPEQHRRAVYLFTQRSLLPPLMTTFDFVDTALPCAQRPVSTVAPQALALLNNSFTHERSQALARRVLAESPPGDVEARIRRAWQRALSRDPSPSELDAARVHLQSQRDRLSRRPGRTPVAIPAAGLVLHLAADVGVRPDAQGRVEFWSDQTGKHPVRQPDPARRPAWIRRGFHGRPAVRFDGTDEFLSIAGQVLTAPSFAVFAVVNDRSSTNQHREIFSNWNGAAGNSGTSVFLGMTGTDATRLCDDFSGVGKVAARDQPFVLAGITRASGVSILQSGRVLASRAAPIGNRNLSTAYVIGQQGNIQGEYWHGDLAELLVYDRELSDPEIRTITASLVEKYELDSQVESPMDPDTLALASLCHVLINTNEFLYVD